MKNWTNLLPWRLKEHQLKSHHNIVLLTITIILCAFTYIALNQYSQQYLQQYQQKYEEYQSIKLKLHQTEQQLNQLQQALQPLTQESAMQIPTNITSTLFSLLAELPIKQGELQHLQFSAKELMFNGYAINNLEFEHIDQFLKKHPQIKQIKLSQFSAQQDGTLQFGFQLKFIGMGDHYE